MTVEPVEQRGEGGNGAGGSGLAGGPFPGWLAVLDVMSMAAGRKPGRARLPVFTSLRGYRPGWLRGDAVAGLTVWAVLVPEALAYASIAGVSPVVGLYAAPGR